MRFNTLKEILLTLPDLGEKLAAAAVMVELDELTRERLTLSASEDVRWRDAFRAELLPAVRQSHFCRYAYDKPRGHPGDYLAQEMIWLARTTGQRLRYIGATPRGRLINSMAMDMPHAVANEERVHWLRRLVLSSPGRRIASIGCGSCIELWDPLVLSLRRDWEILLVDHDEGALGAARRSIAPGTAEVKFIHRDAMSLAMRAETRLGRRDLVYLPGVLD
jgi:hypothetical protein